MAVFGAALQLEALCFCSRTKYMMPDNKSRSSIVADNLIHYKNIVYCIWEDVKIWEVGICSIFMLLCYDLKLHKLGMLYNIYHL